MTFSNFLVSRSQGHQAGGRSNLELFKNLLQPHFLFNSLNNLYALSLLKSDKTPQAIAGLSELLERVVYYSRKEFISLSDEVELIRSYIDLERIWLGENSFMLDFQVRGDTSSVFIPPLAIYTLIENAFKHGVRRSGNQGWITINLVVKPDKILLNVRNSLGDAMPFREAESDSKTGFGIEAVKKLLEGSYKKAYYLDARSLGNVYAVDLIIGRQAA